LGIYGTGMGAMGLTLASAKGEGLVGPEVDVADGIALKGGKDGLGPPLGIIGILSPTLGHADGLVPTLTQLLHNSEVLTGTTDKVGTLGCYAAGEGVVAIHLRAQDVYVVGAGESFQIIGYGLGEATDGEAIQEVGASLLGEILMGETPELYEIATAAEVAPPPEPTALGLVEGTEDEGKEFPIVVAQGKDILGCQIQIVQELPAGIRITEYLADGTAV